MQLLSADEAQRLANVAILRQLTEGVIITDVVGTIKFVNDAAAAIHGVAELGVQPNAYSATYHLYRENGEYYPSNELPLARAVCGETVTDARWKIRRPDGVEVLAIGTAQPLYGATGRRIGAILTLRDQTAADATERALRDAEAANRASADALVTAGATMKSALNEILGHADRLVGETLFDEVQRHRDHMRAAVRTLESVVNTLLAPALSQTRERPTDMGHQTEHENAGRRSA